MSRTPPRTPERTPVIRLRNAEVAFLPCGRASLRCSASPPRFPLGPGGQLGWWEEALPDGVANFRAFRFVRWRPEVEAVFAQLHRPPLPSPDPFALGARYLMRLDWTQVVTGTRTPPPAPPGP